MAVYEAMMLALPLRVQLRATQALHKELRLHTWSENIARDGDGVAALSVVRHTTYNGKTPEVP